MQKAGGNPIYGNGSPPAPDAKVRKVEDDIMKQSSGIQALAKMSLTGEAFPVRPNYGSMGDRTTVWANFFEVKLDSDLSYYRYSVAVAPVGKAPKASKPKIQRLLALLLELDDFQGALTDSRSNLYSRIKLPRMPRELSIAFRAQDEDDAPANPATYTFQIQETGTVLVSEYHQSLGSSNLNDPRFVQRDEVLQALNTAVGHYAQVRPDLVTLGQNRHYAIAKPDFVNLSKGLHALRGFYISFRPATNRILLNVNVSHTVCFEPVTFDSLLKTMGKSELGGIAKKLKLLRIDRLHLRGRKNRAGKEIPSVAIFWDFAKPTDGAKEPNPPQVRFYGGGPKDVKFFLSNEEPDSGGLSGAKSRKSPKPGGGSYISVWDYFTRRYPQVKMYDGFPVINVGNNQFPRYLPVEACKVLPGKVSAAKLNGEQTRAMINFACRRPSDNASSIMNAGRNTLSLDPPMDAGLIKNGLTISPQLITVEARVLKAPPVKYAAAKTIHTIGGSWNLSGQVKFHKGSSVGKWTYLWVRSQQVNTRPTDDFENAAALLETIKKFVSVLNGAGISMTRENLLDKRPVVELKPGADEQNNATLLKCLEYLYGGENNKDMPRFILVILPFIDAGLYSTIKSYCDIKAGIHTVCVVASKFKKGQPTFLANVALKVNLKAGGINQVLEPQKLGIISEGKTMVVGIDVTHPSPLSEETAPSVAGVVASMDPLLGQWPCALRHQKGRTEMVADLEEMFTSRLQYWRKFNKVFPRNILVYRDGVSEGQYQIVLDQELPLLRSACSKLYPPKEQPAITLIIVGKRHHVRFYPAKAEDADQSSWNCKSGTVVDRGVTEVRPWHFYLQAHACIKGTARSAHYYVLVDEIFRARAKTSTDPSKKNAADALEQLTHNLCYLFGRATKAVSVCPPAYYADLLCERSRLYLSRFFDPTTAAGVPAPPGAAQTSTGEAAPVATRASEYTIHPRLVNSMFYI